MLPRLVGSLLLLISATWGQSPALSFEDRFQQILKEADREQLYRLFWTLPKGGELHHHFSLAVPADVWLQAATEARGNLFYTRLRTASCAGDNAPFLRFLTIQRSTWSKLATCQQAEYTPMPELTECQKAEWKGIEGAVTNVDTDPEREPNHMKQDEQRPAGGVRHRIGDAINARALCARLALERDDRMNVSLLRRCRRHKRSPRNGEAV